MTTEGKAGMGPPMPRRPAPPKFNDAQESPAQESPTTSKKEAELEAEVADRAPASAQEAAPAGERQPAGNEGRPAGAQPGGDTAAAREEQERAGKARAAAVAAAAAAAAAKHATPAQRERMIMEAASAALAAQQEREAAAAARGEGGEKKPAGDRPVPPAASYTAPDWGGPPSGIDYSLEVMKGGSVISTLDLSQQAFYTFGRAPNNDVVLEHPSSSRLHGVIQFRGEDGAAFLYDPGSTHGVFLNKKRIPAKKYIPFRVGDIVKFGESSRLYVFGGPQELMPEEGPSREQRRQAAALEAMAARKEREAAIAKAQMEKALGGGASWGMAEDAYDIDEEGGEDIDWRSYASTKGLTEKQQKIADKIRKREARMQHLQREIDKIKSKQAAMEEMSAGQASTLVRNEQEIDKAMEEIEDLEEALCDSIRDSIGAKKREAAAKEGAAAKKKRRRADSDEEYEGSSDDDSFYDRTAGGVVGAKRGSAARGGAGGARGKQQQEVEDAASLYGKKEALLEEKKKLEARLIEEEVVAVAAVKASTASAAPAAAGTRKGPGVKGKEPGSSGPGEVAEEGLDSLDAFMAGVVEAQIEADRVGALRRELAEVEAQLARTQRLLAIADPDGYFQPGSKAAMAAVERAKKSLKVEKQRRAAEERQRQKQAQEAAKKKEAEAFVPEIEEGEEEQVQQQGAQGEGSKPVPSAPPSASLHRLEAEGEASGGLQVRTRPPAAAAPAAGAAGGQQQQAQQQGGKEPVSSYQARRAAIAAALAQQKAGSGSGKQGPAGPGHNKDVAAQAQAQVLADLALLRGAHRGVQEEEEMAEDFDTPEAAAAAAAAYAASRGLKKAEEECGGWRPPPGQTGDGKSALNEKLGY